MTNELESETEPQRAYWPKARVEALRRRVFASWDALLRERERALRHSPGRPPRRATRSRDAIR